MHIKSLKLKNYRNYEALNLQFSPDINIFVGNNAQGKTNILESLYVAAMTSSHRTNRLEDLIEFGHKNAEIDVEVEKKNTTLPLSLSLSSKGRVAKVNHLVQSKLSRYFGQLNAILFSPEDLSLIKHAPSFRRQFLDREIGQIYPKYLHEMIEYRHLLSQRNTYLKKFESIDDVYLDILDESLAQKGAYLMMERHLFITKLEQLAGAIHQRLSLGKEEMTLIYKSSFSVAEWQEEKVKESFLHQLKQRRETDKRHRQTSIGLQREDMQVMINQNNAQLFGSQGQQRLAVLSLKLAEVQLLFEKTGEYPILLLDDVMSELDDERQMKLMETIEGKVQTFITTTTLNHLKDKMTVTPTVFTVEAGKIIKGETQESGRE